MPIILKSKAILLNYSILERYSSYQSRNTFSIVLSPFHRPSMFTLCLAFDFSFCATIFGHLAVCLIGFIREIFGFHPSHHPPNAIPTVVHLPGFLFAERRMPKKRRSWNDAPEKQQEKREKLEKSLAATWSKAKTLRWDSFRVGGEKGGGR